MPFPDVQRFIYSKNPLELVICQVRFPTILRIDTDLPVQFQESIRESYPILTQNTQAEVQLPPEIRELAAPLFALNKPKNAFNFASEDGAWTISLTSDFLALTTTSYKRWESFRDHMEEAFNALIKVYSPAFFTRVGLRYRDIIKRSSLAIDPTVAWSDLLQPHIAGEFASRDVSADVLDKTTTTRLRLNAEHEFVNIRHGLAQDTSTGEIVYVIDSDFYTEQRLNPHDVFETLTKFNRNGRLLFRWCITDKLHNIMEPTPIP